MKLLVRISAVSLVVAGAFASSMTPKVQASAVVNHNTMVTSSAFPIPSCDPGKTGCGIP
jgi:hypothetical protein